ncbi:MAG TPA: sulfotransferase family 2 domain-containing protein [Mycobacteriales bacterium]|jgi:hypothetical protein|nr:sulfotransferase family 2 domain-containing protein [Mycobacteriales bacterium]
MTDEARRADTHPHSEHLLSRTIVLPDRKLLFLPVPKTGCTSVLWLLARLAGLPRERFERSTGGEVTRELTVHDMRVWGPSHQLGSLSPELRERALTEPGWLRFALVRDPAARLWSAWQSKLLLREPRFVHDFGAEPWFPRMPGKPDDVVADFRRFVAALGPSGPHDVHWAVQHELTDALPLTHVGRIERLDETLTLLAEHVGEELTGAARPGRDNPALIRMPSDAYDAEAAATVNHVYRGDFDAFGYPAVEAGPADERWAPETEQLLPAVHALADRHSRIGVLGLAVREGITGDEAQRLRQRVRELERELTGVTAAGAGRAAKAAIVNREGESAFDISWRWAEDAPLQPGFTAVLRVKNEANALPFVLPWLFAAVRSVLLVDNGSTDGTPEVAQRLAAEAGAADRFEVLTYPFSVSRCGPEHLGTAADSIHSLTYFYNWAFSHVPTTYALKWDGDMVLTDTGIAALRDLEWQTETGEFVVVMPRYPLYVANDNTAYLDAWVANREYWAWPNRKGYEHSKAFEWELSTWPEAGRTISLPDWSCVELKHLDVDEFAHWSDADFTASGRTSRKRRELEVFQALAADGQRLPDGLVRVDSTDGVNVIDYVRSEWLPQEKSRLRALHREVRPDLYRRR